MGVVGAIVASLMGNDAISYLPQIALLIPSIAVSVRRMHDVDKSGWFILIPIYSFILTVTPSTVGPNGFGEL